MSEDKKPDPRAENARELGRREGRQLVRALRPLVGRIKKLEEKNANLQSEVTQFKSDPLIPPDMFEQGMSEEVEKLLSEIDPSTTKSNQQEKETK